jgi:hypothetical protein
VITLRFQFPRLRFPLGKQRVYRQVARLYRLIGDLDLAHFGVEQRVTAARQQRVTTACG